MLDILIIQFQSIFMDRLSCLDMNTIIGHFMRYFLSSGIVRKGNDQYTSIYSLVYPTVNSFLTKMTYHINRFCCRTGYRTDKGHLCTRSPLFCTCQQVCKESLPDQSLSQKLPMEYAKFNATFHFENAILMA